MIINKGVKMAERTVTFMRHNFFLRGFARVVDIAGSIDRDALMRHVNSRSSSDAIRGDWNQVGNDIKKVISEYRDETAVTSK